MFWEHLTERIRYEDLFYWRTGVAIAIIPRDFFNALSFPATYLDIYDSRLEEQLILLQALKDWFMAQVDMDDDTLLIAHSFGADLQFI